MAGALQLFGDLSILGLSKVVECRKRGSLLGLKTQRTKTGWQRKSTFYGWKEWRKWKRFYAGLDEALRAVGSVISRAPWGHTFLRVWAPDTAFYCLPPGESSALSLMQWGWGGVGVGGRRQDCSELPFTLMVTTWSQPGTIMTVPVCIPRRNIWMMPGLLDVNSLLYTYPFGL